MAYNVTVFNILLLVCVERSDSKFGPHCVPFLTKCKPWERTTDHHHPKIVGTRWVGQQHSFGDKNLPQISNEVIPINVWAEEFIGNRWKLNPNSREGIKEMWYGFIIQNYEPTVRRAHTPSVFTKSFERILHLVNLVFCEIKEAADSRVIFYVAGKHEPWSSTSTLSAMGLYSGSPRRANSAAVNDVNQVKLS